MEEKSSVKILSISDLLHGSRPLTGAYDLSSGRRSPSPTQKENCPGKPDENPSSNQKFLKPLNYPTLLIGTLTLNPTHPSSCSNSICFKFSDDSATICCDILDLDLKVIGKRIKVLAWNFIPMKPHGGFLEIIRWVLDELVTNSVSNLNAFPLNSAFPAAYDEASISRYFVYGLVESVSPVTNVPCTAGKNDTQNVSGFLAQILVCRCKLCGSKDRVMRVQNITEEQNKGHNFTKSEIVYFYGSASVWYPAISRLIGRTILLSGMKKKLVFIGKEESLMMYVTAEKSVLHLQLSPSKRALSGKKGNITEKGERYVYTGSVTSIYMQGMVIELDQKVYLLLTDHQLSMPHSLRVGAIVTVRSFHLVNPKFSWREVRIIGSCFETSVHVNVFSPIESGCYLILQSQSLLRKFIESVAFSARLWVLLVVSSLRKKFAGILSEKEILGSRHREGLVQKYSSSCLPLSVFRFRHGVFKEYCQHDTCGCGNEVEYNPPKLVVPISNFICQCETTFTKMLSARPRDSGSINMNHQDSLLFCEGKSYEQPVRKVLRSEDMNVVLLGSLKISRYSGRLQLIDATGCIDAVIPDLPSFCSMNDIYEINDYSIVMEGISQRSEHLGFWADEPFSCRNILGHFQSVGQRMSPMYIYFHLRTANSRNHPICPGMEREEIFQEVDSGNFHLLWVMHKFPVQTKFPGDEVVSDSSCTYAEAIILPWNLFILKKDRDPGESYSCRNSQEHATFKRCKREQTSTSTLSSCFSNAGSNLFAHLDCLSSDGRSSNDFNCPHEIPCTIGCRVSGNKFMVTAGTLWNSTESIVQGKSFCKRATGKLLLEFRSDTFLKYEMLRMGSYYMMKHKKEDILCAGNECGNISDDKVVINPKSVLWTVSFSNDEARSWTAESCSMPYSNVSYKEVQSESSHHVEIPGLRSADGCPEICPDVYLYLAADHLSFLEVKLKALKEEFVKPITTIKEVFNCSTSPQFMMSALKQSSGMSTVNMPMGNLLSVQGHVVAVHNSDQNSLAGCLGHNTSCGAHQEKYLHGVTTSVCIHLLREHNTVKIRSYLSKHAYPTGFGLGVNAIFHRVLVTAGRDALILIPASFIEINPIMIVNHQCENTLDDTPVSSTVENSASLPTGPAALISETLQLLDCRSVRLNCKVAAIYVLLLEKNNEVPQSHSGIPSVKIPLAGFVMDDGSSSCCC